MPSFSDRSLPGALSVLAAFALVLHPTPAAACAPDSGLVLDVTFDPAVLGDLADQKLFYDPSFADFDASCDQCELIEQDGDWGSYLPSFRHTDTFNSVLFRASLEEIDGLIHALKGEAAPPAKFAKTSLFDLKPPERQKLISALYLAGFARRVEPFAHFATKGWSDQSRATAIPDPATAKALIQAGEHSLSLARDPFLRQRYAFLLTRLHFYARDWAGTVTFVDAHRDALEEPSPALHYRALYYQAGALLRAGQRARGNLELAHVHVGLPNLRPATTNDFHPASDAEWQQTLALAKTPEDRVALWRLYGLRGDGVTALEQIARIQPDSPLAPLLAVRELNRLEMQAEPDMLARLEQACRALAAQPVHGWMYALMAGHAAALEGKLPDARRLLAQAVKARPSDPAVEQQADVSMTYVLALAVKRNPSLQDELARRLGALKAHPPPLFDFLYADVKASLGIQELTAWDAGDALTNDPAKLAQALHALKSAHTPYQKLLVSELSPGAVAGLRVQALIVRGRFAEARRAAAEIPPGASRPVVLPRKEPILACYQCTSQDDQRFDLRSLADRLVTLEKASGGQGDAAARAALEIGRVLMHLSLLDIGGSRTAQGARALHWFDRAYTVAADPELKAQAAYFGARCKQLDQTQRTWWTKDVPRATDWYQRLATTSQTPFHREVLKECGWYRAWYKNAR